MQGLSLLLAVGRTPSPSQMKGKFSCGVGRICYPRQMSQKLKMQKRDMDLRFSRVDDGIVMPSPTSLGRGIIVSVAAGGRHSLALSDEGIVWGWGYGAEGQLGVGCRLGLTSSPQRIDFPQLLNRANYGVNDGKRVSDRVGARVIKIACGGRHSVVLTDAGCILTFGWGLYGQCGQGHTDDHLSPTYVNALSGVQVTTLAAGLWHTVFGTKLGDVYVTGGNQFGQLGTGGDQAEVLPTLVDASVLENENVTDVSCGARHTVVLTDQGNILGWGWNKYGQLGLGDNDQRDTPVQVPLKDGVIATSIACGWWHTLALVELRAN